MLAIVPLLELFDVSPSLYLQHSIINNYGAGQEPDYIDLNVNFTNTVIKAATIVQYFPPFLKP